MIFRIVKVLISAMAFMTLALPGMSQEKWKLELSYNPNVPMSSFKEYIDQTSRNGWGVRFAFGVNPSWEVGANFGFQDYYKKLPRQVYITKDGEISAVQSRSIQTVPLMVNVRYKFGEEGGIRPFLGSGIGGAFVTNSVWWGQFSETDKGFRFAIAPEAGVSIPVGRFKTSSLNLGLNYNYSGYKTENYDNISGIGLRVGLAFPL
ncbi:MAG TPA: outer membrane beta-barrel protein [Parasegetibacter sp.]